MLRAAGPLRDVAQRAGLKAARERLSDSIANPDILLTMLDNATAMFTTACDRG
ncbi:hypothetical protein ACSNOI_37980 [Actinomadura kijaniata]|uniref:hypothetical protein n=1 Tax=Actinomadura kijaniata TaxID=46161 RepID=UPI003F1C9A35